MEDAGEVLDASRSLSDDELPAVGKHFKKSSSSYV
jgi:hypothetical protein